MAAISTRRTFLVRLLGVGTGVALLSGGALWRWFRRRPLPSVDAPGPFAPEVLSTLMAVTETVIARPLEPDHYREFLRWRAENLPGFRAVCQRFARHVEEAARASGRAFAALEPAARAKIVDQALASRDPRLAEFATIRHELLVLYSRTDAFIALGYDSWPGVPRGLVAYLNAPVRPSRP